MSFMFTAAGGVWIICHSCQGLIRVQMCVLCSLYMSVIVVLICIECFWSWCVCVCVCAVREVCSSRYLGPRDRPVFTEETGNRIGKQGGAPPQILWRRWQAAPRKAPPRWSSRSRATACSSAASTRRPWPATAKPSWVEEVTSTSGDLWPAPHNQSSSNSQQYTDGSKLSGFLLCQKSWTISKDHVL